MTNKLSKVVLLVSLLLLGSYSVATPSDNSSDDSDILDLVMLLLPALAKSQISISDAEEEGFKVSLDKIYFGDKYTFQLAIDKPYTKDVECYVGKAEISRLDNKNFCSVGTEHSGRVGQHSISRSFIDHPSGDYFLTIINDNNQELRSKPFHLPPKQPTYEIRPPTYTSLDSVELGLSGEPHTTIILNGVDKGLVPVSGKATITLDTSGETGVREFVIALRDNKGLVSELPYPIKMKKLASVESIQLLPGDIQMSLDDEIALNDVISFSSSTLSAADFGFNRIVTALISYKDGGDEVLPAIDLDLVINDESIAHITGTVGTLPSGISIKMPILKGLKNGSTTLTARLDDFTSNSVNIVVSDDTEEDQIPPQIILHGYNPVNLLVGQNYQEYSALAVDNVDGRISIRTEGQVDPSTEGNYEITYTASDDAGNTTTSVRKVIVKNPDTTNPSRIILFPPFAEITQGEIVALQTEVTFPDADDPKSIDDLDIKGLAVYAYYDNDYIPQLIPAKDVVLTISDTSIIERSTETITDKASGSSIDIPVLRALKAGSVTAIATIGTTESSPITITVNQLPPDTTAPPITLTGDAEINLFEGGSFVDEGATATDDRDGEVEVSVSGTVDTSTVGTYLLTYTARDEAGNSQSTSRKVNILKDNYIRVKNIKNTDLNLNYICRAGDELEVSGSNFSDISSSIVLNIIDNGVTLDIQPLSVSDDKINFLCPSLQMIGEKTLYIKSQQKISLEFGVFYTEGSSPIINNITKNSNSINISGYNLDSIFSINFNGDEMLIDNSGGDPSLVEGVEILETAISGYLYIDDEVNGKSNPFYLSIDELKNGNITSYNPSINLDDIFVWSGGENNINNGYTFDFNVDKGGSNKIIASFIRNDNGSFSDYLSAIYLNGDENLSINSLSTAISLIWKRLNTDYLSNSKLRAMRETIGNLQETTDLAVLIESSLSESEHFMNGDLVSIENNLDSAVYKANLAFNEQMTSLASRTSSGLVAEITPSSSNGVSLKEQTNGSGNLLVINNTQLPLSVKMISTKGDILLNHNITYFGFGSIGSQDPYFNKNIQSLDQPNGKDCNVEILTAADLWISDPDSPDAKVIKALRRKFILDIFWGLTLKHIFKNDVYKNIIYAELMTREFMLEADKGNINSSIKILSENIEYVLRSLSDKFNPAFILESAIKLLKNYLKGLEIANKLYDFLSVDSKIIFNVHFKGLLIDSITPNEFSVYEKSPSIDTVFKVSGRNFHAAMQISLYVSNDDQIPKIDPIRASIKSINNDKTEMEISVSTWEIERVYGEARDFLSTVQLSASFSDGVFSESAVKKNNFVELNNKLVISSVTPSEGFEGDEVTLRGSGFSVSNDYSDYRKGNEVYIGDTPVEIISIDKAETADEEDEVVIEIPHMTPGDYGIKAKLVLFDSSPFLSNSIDFEVKSKICGNNNLVENYYSNHENNDGSIIHVLTKKIEYRDSEKCEPSSIKTYKAIKNSNTGFWEGVMVSKQSFSNYFGENSMSYEAIYTPALDVNGSELKSMLNSEKEYGYSYGNKTRYLSRDKKYRVLKNQLGKWQSLIEHDKYNSFFHDEPIKISKHRIYKILPSATGDGSYISIQSQHLYDSGYFLDSKSYNDGVKIANYSHEIDSENDKWVGKTSSVNIYKLVGLVIGDLVEGAVFNQYGSWVAFDEFGNFSLIPSQ